MRMFSRALVCMALIACAATAFGQGITTAILSGTVNDNNGGALPGAVVNAVHQPTGTRYSTVTRANGSWKIINVRVGGPYTVEASMSGFSTQKKDNLFVKLAEEATVDFRLSPEAVAEELVVVAESNPIINPSREGAASNVSEEAIEALPSISRSFEDFARTNPYFNITDTNGGVGSISVAGRSNRYNNILIDGAVNNDLFGLSASGTPGGQAEAPYISLDAVKEVQLVVSPYDVRQGGFSGGGVNAVTRSGSNTFEGSLFHFWRNETFIGNRFESDGDFIPLGDLAENQTGFRIGGPIIKDKLFFFFSGEQRRRSRPGGWSISENGEGGGQNFGHYEEALRFQQILRDQYGYDPGGLDEISRDTDSDTFFLRFDYNLGMNHQLTLRHNFVDAENLRLSNSSRTFQFPGNHQYFPSETNSTVLQLNSTLGNFFNEFRLSYSTVKDRRRGVGQPFPWIEIERLQGGGEFEAGTERFSTANALDQNVLEITNDLTFFVGNHTITIGTHNELFSFDNLFIRENYGAYEFSTLDDFEAGNVRRFNYSFSLTDDPQESSKFDVQQIGLYIGDQWSIRPDFNVTMGIRADMPLFSDTPTRNPLSEEVFGRRTDQTADGNLLVSPRVGFNWDILGDGTRQLRGGLGIFTGRMPYVWYSNQYGNTGVEFGRISATASDDNPIAFNPDPFGQPQDPTLFSDAFGNEIDLIDDGFKLPQLWRLTLGYDHDLGVGGLIATAEFMLSETINDIVYKNINWVESGETLFDGRPVMTRVDNRFRDIILLENTSQGRTMNASVKLERPFQDGLAWSVSYIHGKAESVNDGTSSQARSNWRHNSVGTTPNDPELGTSIFDVKHRFNGFVSYRMGKKAPTTVSLFYNVQSGRPYSTTFRFDANGDREANDLIFVPDNVGDFIIIDDDGNDMSAEFDAYIESDRGLRAARGGIVERNASRAPWRRTLDFRLTQDVRVKNYKFQLSLDILNFLNMLDNSEGLVRYANFNELSPVSYEGIDEATGKPIYEVQFADPDAKFQTDDLRSRYQIQLGARFTF